MIAAISYSQWLNASEAVGDERSAANATARPGGYGCTAATHITPLVWATAASDSVLGSLASSASRVTTSRTGFSASNIRTNS